MACCKLVPDTPEVARLANCNFCEAHKNNKPYALSVWMELPTMTYTVCENANATVVIKLDLSIRKYCIT